MKEIDPSLLETGITAKIRYGKEREKHKLLVYTLFRFAYETSECSHRLSVKT